MDKRKLNNEIVLCRAAVRKAKVAVIRKILKNMKILKSCKVEAVKEKKLKKSERLFEKVQVMKKLKDDEVTKFALRHADVEAFLKGPKPNIRQSALAHLAKHPAVAKKVNFIREQFQNWESELPLLLESLGKRKKKVVNLREIAKTSYKGTAVNAVKSKNASLKVVRESGTDGEVKKNVSVGEVKVRRDKKRTGGESERKKTGKGEDQSLGSDSEGGRTSGEIEKLEPIKKIEDPFFIGKKIVAPKLVLESASDKKNSNKLGKAEMPALGREKSNSGFGSRGSRGRRNSSEFGREKPLPVAEEEKLHPSWAAKKVKLIKPFQGKKIKFSED